MQQKKRDIGAPKDQTDKRPPRADAPEAGAASEAVRARYEFYKDLSRRSMPLLMASLLLNGVLVAGDVAILTHRPPPRYVPTRPDGGVLPEKPLNEPIVSNAALFVWASRAVTTAYTYNFASYREQFMRASDAFTDEGWINFIKAIERSNNLPAVAARRLTVTATVRAAPVLVEPPKLERGVLTWVMEIPLSVTYQSGTERTAENLSARTTVVRRRTIQSPDGSGLGISQLIVTSGTGSFM